MHSQRKGECLGGRVVAWRQGKVGGIGAKESNKMRIIVNSPCTATTRVCVACVCVCGVCGTTASLRCR